MGVALFSFSPKCMLTFYFSFQVFVQRFSFSLFQFGFYRFSFLFLFVPADGQTKNKHPFAPYFFFVVFSNPHWMLKKKGGLKS
jgi:hypothetical protein